MVRRVFYSFHYEPDSWRASKVRNIGAIEGNKPTTDNRWEAIKNGGDAAIERWIADQMENRTCTVVLVGAKTASRPWIRYEIAKSWKDGMGVVGVRIHGLKDQDGFTSTKGDNPFDYIGRKKKLSSIVQCYNPAGANSRERYKWISKHLAYIVEEAINIRQEHRRREAHRRGRLS